MLEAFQKASRPVFIGSLAVTVGALAVEGISTAVFIADHLLTGRFNGLAHQVIYIAAGTGLAAGAAGLTAAAGWAVVQYRKDKAERLVYMETLKSQEIRPQILPENEHSPTSGRV